MPVAAATDAKRDGRARLWSWSGLATFLFLVAVLLSLGEVPLTIVLRDGIPGGLVLFVFTLAAVGVVVARREPANPIGWLLLCGSLVFALGRLALKYAYLDYAIHDGRLPLGTVAVLLSQAWIYVFFLFPLIVLLVPTGRLAAGWRWPVGVSIAVGCYIASTISVAIVALGQRVPVNSQLEVYGSNDPRGAAAWAGPVNVAATLVLGALCVGAIAYQVVAFRRSSGERRQQIKWLGVGAAMALAVLLVAVVWNSAPSFVGNVLTPLAICGIPVSIGVGILRYRLYEIDRLVSRTLSYAILTALLVGTFVGLVALTTNTLALSGNVGVAASTLCGSRPVQPSPATDPAPCRPSL